MWIFLWDIFCYLDYIVLLLGLIQFLILMLQAFLFLQTYRSGVAHCQRITYSTQEVQTDDTMLWPLEAEAEEIDSEEIVNRIFTEIEVP